LTTFANKIDTEILNLGNSGHKRVGRDATRGFLIAESHA